MVVFCCHELSGDAVYTGVRLHGRRMRGHLVVCRDMAGGKFELGPCGGGVDIAQCGHRHMAVVLFEDRLAFCAPQHGMGHHGAHVYLLHGFMGGAERAELGVTNHQHVSPVGMGEGQKRLLPAAAPFPCRVGCYRGPNDHPHGCCVLAAGHRAHAVGKPRETPDKCNLLHRRHNSPLGSDNADYRL